MELGGSWNYCTPHFCAAAWTVWWGTPSLLPCTHCQQQLLLLLEKMYICSLYNNFPPVNLCGNKWGEGKEERNCPSCLVVCPVARPSSQDLSKYIWMGNIKDNMEILPTRCEYSTLWDSVATSMAFRGRVSVKGAGNSSRQCFLRDYQCAGLRMWSEIMWGH